MCKLAENNDKIDLVLITANGEVQPHCEKYLGMNDHEMMELIVTREGKKENVNVKMVNFNMKAGANKHKKKIGKLIWGKEIGELSVP